jgi:hypothetical protein
MLTRSARLVGSFVAVGLLLAGALAGADDGPGQQKDWSNNRIDWQFQWAAAASASSQYSEGGWSAQQLVGYPNTFAAGDHATAWAPATVDRAIESIELTYRYPVIPTFVQIRETSNEGSVVKVQLLPEDAEGGEWVTVLERTLDPAVKPKNESVTINDVGTPGFNRPTRRVRLEIDTSRPGWEEIDAVALIGKFLVGPAGSDMSTGAYRLWPLSARASSQYGEPPAYSPQKATGAPDTPLGTDAGTAWAPGVRDGGLETLEVTYMRVLVATEVNIVESCGPGAVRKLEAQVADGGWVTLWEGQDPTSAPGTFSISLAGNQTPANWYRITLDTSVPGWNEIDAVELVGNPHPDFPGTVEVE